VEKGAIKCPIHECELQRSIVLPEGVAAAALTSNVDWARQLPLAHGLIASIQHQLSATRHQLPCQFFSCAHASTLHCSDCSACGLSLCAEHDRVMHRGLSTHQRISMQQHAEQQAQTSQREVLAPVAAARRQRGKDKLARQKQMHQVALQDAQEKQQALAKAQEALAHAKRRVAEQQENLTQSQQQVARFEKMSDADVLLEPDTPTPASAP